MTWGISMPVSFGDFFPDGEYNGWDERLAHRFRHELSDAERENFNGRVSTYALNVSEKFNREIGVPRPNGRAALSPVHPDELPHEFVTAKTYKSLGALAMLNDRLLIVSHVLKEVIENTERGVHRFWPFRIVMPKKVEYPEPYFGMIIGNFRSSFDPQASDESAWRCVAAECYFANANTKACFSKLVLNRSKIGQAHLWRERELLSPGIFMSDTLYEEIQKRGLKLPKHNKVSEA